MTAEPHTVLETAYSILEFNGDVVRKRKRPMHTRWIDWSTPALRQRACANEVALNRLLAPDVYLGVEDEFAADGSLRDAVVVMRRLPADRQLSHMVNTARLVADDVEAVARSLATFHAALPSDVTVAVAATPNALRDWWRLTIGEFQSDPETVLLLRDVLDLAVRYIDGCAPLFSERIHHGCIVDGHGDLGTDNVFLLPDGPCILDRLDTNGWLRHGDVIQDLAALTLDLELMGAPTEAAHLRRAYGELTATKHPVSLEHFYAAKRALQLATTSWPVPRTPIERLLRVARRHLRAALPHLRLIGGLPGTGKTTVAAEVGTRLSAVVLHEHEIAREQDGVRDLVTLAANTASYEEMFRRAAVAMSHGESVVLDADFSTAAQRTDAVSIATDRGFAVTEFQLSCSPAIMAERFTLRPERRLDDDLTLEDVRALRGRFDPWPSAVSIDASGTVGDTADRVLGLEVLDVEDRAGGAPLSVGPRPPVAGRSPQ